MLARTKKAASFIQDRLPEGFVPRIGVILGSGLGGFADTLADGFAIEYAQIPGFPVSTVEGHRGRLVGGWIDDRAVVAMQGRFHYYEGYTPAEVVMPVRVMRLLGVDTLMVSNAAGGVNESFRVGDVMVITDHVNLIPNPLVGPNEATFGPRFPDMHDCYDPELRLLALDCDSDLREGVYVGGTGPTFETQAEYRFYRAIGGDAAGMSTTPEVIAARHAGMRVFGASVITNEAFSTAPSDHADVQLQAQRAGERMTRLFRALIQRMDD